MSDEDEDLEWNEWLELTDEQQEAIIDREMMALRRKLDAMTIAQQVAHHRHFVLKSIRKNRARLHMPEIYRIPVITDLIRKNLQNGRIRLVKLRIWRATGTYPGQG